tara:strand:- start:1260 stop:2339 length:1080 start_codon:yes stop_codon:yes gene_type:complete
MTDNNIELEDSPEEEIQEASVEEAVDPKDAEAASVAAADKAADAGKTAPARKMAGGTAADNTTKDPAPKTKAGMINAMFSKMNNMSKKQLGDMYSTYESTEFDEDANEVREVAETATETNVDFSNDLNALVESEATLSAEFKTKAATIFEAALNTKLSEEIDRIEDQYKNELNEEITATKAELVEKVDNYLNYVVENWMKENTLAIQSGLRTEIAEGFMNNLKDLFTESYIEVPESKVDLVDDLSGQVAELEEQLNNQTEQSINQLAELEDLKRDSIIREACKGLAETQVEKLLKLAENVDFENEETFTDKVNTLKENYFKTKTQVVSEEQVDEDDSTVVAPSGSMSQYLEAIRKTDKN